MKVIGAGVGRTGTLSLKAALERLGFGPCFHGRHVLDHPDRLPMWRAAAAGEPVDWRALFAGLRVHRGLAGRGVLAAAAGGVPDGEGHPDRAGRRRAGTTASTARSSACSGTGRRTTRVAEARRTVPGLDVFTEFHRADDLGRFLRRPVRRPGARDPGLRGAQRGGTPGDPGRPAADHRAGRRVGAAVRRSSAFRCRPSRTRTSTTRRSSGPGWTPGSANHGGERRARRPLIHRGRERMAQPRQAAPDPGLGRAQRDPLLVGDLPGRQPVDRGQHDRPRLLGGQRPQSRPHPLGAARRRLLGRGRPGCRSAARDRPDSRGAAGRRRPTGCG